VTVSIMLILGGAAAAGAEVRRLPSQTETGGYCAALLGQGAQVWDDEGTPGAGVYPPARAGAMSFMLPGLGQQRMGHTRRAAVYMSLETAGWITAGASLWQSIARRSAYEDYAVAFAGVDGTGYGKDYYRTVGGYISNEGPGGYNEYIRREARDLYYPDLEAMERYYEQNAITGTLGWRWETDAARGRFNHLRRGSESAQRRALYAGFFLLGLRIASAVDAVVLARGPQAESAAVPRQIGLEIGPRPGGFYLALNRPF